MKTGTPPSIAEILLAKASLVGTPLAGKQIDSVRGASKLDHLLRLHEISFLKAGAREPELIQKIHKQSRVVGRGPDQNIQVPV